MGYRYIGNKTRLADRLYDIIRRYIRPESRIADPMCGTAAVSAKFRQESHQVIAGDLMHYSGHHARTRLLLDEPPQFPSIGLDYHGVLEYLNQEVKPLKSLFFNEYSPGGTPIAGTPPRKYFTPENAMKIDGILKQLSDWEASMPAIEISVLRHDLILAVNSISNIAGTYGHYRSTFSRGSMKSLELTPSKFAPGRTDHVVSVGPADRTLAEHSADAVYLDPPYKKRQYAANYHILETIARGDSPTPTGVSGLRNWWPEYSDFCSKLKIAQAFHSVFEASDAPIFFISYSEDGLIPDSKMREILEHHGTVTRHELKHSRFKSNSAGIGGMLDEYLYVVQRSS